MLRTKQLSAALLLAAFAVLPAGQTDADGLVNYTVQGGFVPAISNLYKAGSALVNDIVDTWQ